MATQNKAVDNLFTLVFVLTLPALALLPGCDKTESPEDLFRAIQRLSRAGRYDEIKNLVYPLEVEGESIVDLVVAGIKAESYPPNGDFAFSARGLEALINKHMHRFRRYSDEEIAEYRPIWRSRPADISESESKFLQLLDDDPGAFRVFSHVGVNIHIVKVEGKYKLIFWEHLPKLAGEQPDLN